MLLLILSPSPNIPTNISHTHRGQASSLLALLTSLTQKPEWLNSPPLDFSLTTLYLASGCRLAVGTLMAALMSNETFLLSTASRNHIWINKDIKFLVGPNIRCRVSLPTSTTPQPANLPDDRRICVFKPSAVSRIKCFQHEDSETDEAAAFTGNPEGQDKAGDAVLPILPAGKSSAGPGRSFLATLVILLGIALALTLLSIGSRQQPNHPGSFFGIQYLADGSSPSALSASTGGFSFRVFGYRFLLPEYAPGWIYFWLLMAAGCGLFISEEALNIWVGINLSRLLSFDGSWQSFVDSFSRNAPYIASTVLWVYWGVCISDMVPFYLGKLFRQSGASDDVCAKLGIGKEKAMSITRVVQKYGNLVGFVERFSLGVRNPTAFLAGAMDISPEFFFAGVCCGGLLTLPIQLGIGFIMRERPVFALATVATVVGVWTVFPYAAAALTAFFLYLRRKYSS